MTEEQERVRLSPDEAFSTLGNEIRIRILSQLGDADGPLSFSALYDRLEVSDSAQFNYHLDKLLGHFVRKLDNGYALSRPGQRVVEAILSGAVTDDPELDRTGVEDRCSSCNRQLEIAWRNGSVELFCADCQRRWSRSWGRVGGPQEAPPGYLGRLPFPPAGLDNRSPSEILRTAYTWTNLELLAVASGLCPRCAATVERELNVCEDHDASEGPCEACGTSHAMRLTASCTNCIYSVGSAAAWGLLPTPELLTFLFDHDINPIAPNSAHRLDQVLNEYDETIHSLEPFRATMTFTTNGDSLSLTVDRTLEICEIA